ncbi:MAG: sigma 54-interacting transcriptional regulator [Planctomycetaceae bacterium]
MPKRRRSGLANWLSETDTPIFVLDDRRVVLFFNQGCERLTGWSAGDVVGQRCDYVTDVEIGSVRSLTGALAPPPNAITRMGEVVAVQLPHVEGRSMPRAIHYFPLPGAEGSPPHLMGVIVPLSQLVSSDGVSLGGDVPSPQNLHAQLGSLRSEIRERYKLETLIAQSPAMQRVLDQVDIAHRVSTPIMLLGEEGVGREHIARAIHYAGPQKLQPFVPVDCSALPRTELAAVLHRLFERHTPEERPLPAQRPGGLFLRRISHMPLDLQVWLLSQIRESSRDGRSLDTTLDAEGRHSTSQKRGEALRIFVSDETDLLNRPTAGEKSLHPELREALSALVIQIPPLADRPDELPLLAQWFLEECNREQSRQLGGFTPAVWHEFRKYQWPGNVRQLKQVVREACQHAAGTLVDVADLPFRFRSAIDASSLFPRPEAQKVDLQKVLDDYERLVIMQVLEETQGNRSRAAELLSMTRPRLYRRLEQLGLDSNDKPTTP